MQRKKIPPEQPISRRTFIRTTAIGTLGLTLLPHMRSMGAPSEIVRVAHIGLGGMGTQHMKWFAALPNVEIVGLCDVDQSHLNQAAQTLKDLNSSARPALYEDFRRILDRKDVDAITCATPDHWHAQIASLAFQAGKDVYGEKPLSYDVAEGQKMLRLLNSNKRIFQLGTQIHAGENYHRVVDIIKSGVIGRVHTVRLWKNSFSKDMGFPKVQPPPSTLNWDMWLGPAPYTEYMPERCHVNFRHFIEYSGGTFADFWCHIADVVWWAVAPINLRTIHARGEKTGGIGGVPKWLDVDYEFDNLKIFWTTKPPDVPGAAEHNIGAYFEGEKGTLLCDYNTRSITINGETVEDIPTVAKTVSRSPGHQQNFIDSIKSRVQPESNLAYAGEMTLPMHLAIISWRLNRKLRWKPKKEKFKSDPEANSLLSREYRKEWNLL
jgi:predicted dehydrogenase